MYADAVEACLFAADCELDKIKQRPTDGNSESYADTCHLATSSDQLDHQNYSTSNQGGRVSWDGIFGAGLVDRLPFHFGTDNWLRRPGLPRVSTLATVRRVPNRAQIAQGPKAARTTMA
jgi:hypothetical protein